MMHEDALALNQGHRLEAADLQQLDSQGFYSRFKVASNFAKGGFADVLHVRDGTTDAALKVLRPSPPDGLSLDDVAAADADGISPAMSPEVCLFREARALKHAKHPNVLELRSVLHLPRACLQDGSTSRSSRRSAGNKQGSCWALLLEFMQGGSLMHQVYEAMVSPYRKCYSYTDALTWAVDVASGVAHLHSLDPVIIHRDLKLENILLQTPAAGCGRQLPVAKLSDFGLHVMIDRPASPFFVGSGEDGTPVLILHPQHQEQQLAPSELFSDAAASSTSRACHSRQPSNSSMPAAPEDHQQQKPQQQHEAEVGKDQLQQNPCMLACNDSSGHSNPDAVAQVHSNTAAATKGANKQAWPSVLKATGYSTNSTANTGLVVQEGKRVAFQDLSTDSPCAHSGKGSNRASSCNPHADMASATAAADVAPTSDQQQQQEGRQGVQPSWQRLTCNTLRRLSLDSCRSLPQSARSGHSSATGTWGQPPVSSPVAIPLLLQAQSGPAASFVTAAVPLEALEPAEDACGAGYFVPAAAGAGATDGTLTACNCSCSAPAASPAAAAAGGVEGDFSWILAAANTPSRDYVVNLHPDSLAGASLQCCSSRPSTDTGSIGGIAGSNPLSQSSVHHAAGDCAAGHGMAPSPQGPPSSVSATPTASAAAAATNAASLCSQSTRSSDWPTAASMLWDDLMEEESQQELLDTAVPAHGALLSVPWSHLVQLPLSYDLTCHTGSFMYMAPEVFKGLPYNESADTFSLGVIIFELFSRSLLVCNHTPANSPDDCLRYAARVSVGFRPKQPKAFPLGVWRVVEACWQQNPADRPPAVWVLQQLQQLLRQEEQAAAAAAAAARRSAAKRPLMRLLRLSGMVKAECGSETALKCSSCKDNNSTTANGIGTASSNGGLGPEPEAAAAVEGGCSKAVVVAEGQHSSGKAVETGVAAALPPSCGSAGDAATAGSSITGINDRKDPADTVPKQNNKPASPDRAGRVPACGCVIC